MARASVPVRSGSFAILTREAPFAYALFAPWLAKIYVPFVDGTEARNNLLRID
jgi:hypothetical protein